MRTISAVWSSWGPTPQLRTFTEALHKRYWYKHITCSGGLSYYLWHKRRQWWIQEYLRQAVRNRDTFYARGTLGFTNVMHISQMLTSASLRFSCCSPSTPVAPRSDCLEDKRILVAHAVVTVCCMVWLRLVLGREGGDQTGNLGGVCED